MVSVISASYYLKIVKLLHMESSDKDENNLSPKGDNADSYQIVNSTNLNKLTSKINSNYNLFKISNLHSFTISVLTLTILLFVLKPSLLLNSTQLLSLSLYNF